MIFGLAITSSSGMRKSNLIVNLSDDMKEYFKDKNYSNDIKSYTIGVHCVDIPPGFEKFSKLPKPKYTKGRRIINPDGIPFILEDNFEYSIKLDFKTFNKASDEDANRILATEILQSLKVLDEMKSKIKNFDAKKFKEDLESFFRERGLI